jgi:hypothetical protein
MAGKPKAAVPRRKKHETIVLDFVSLDMGDNDAKAILAPPGPPPFSTKDRKRLIRKLRWGLDRTDKFGIGTASETWSIKPRRLVTRAPPLPYLTLGERSFLVSMLSALDTPALTAPKRKKAKGRSASPHTKQEMLRVAEYVQHLTDPRMTNLDKTAAVAQAVKRFGYSERKVWSAVAYGDEMKEYSEGVARGDASPFESAKEYKRRLTQGAETGQAAQPARPVRASGSEIPDAMRAIYTISRRGK